MSETIEYIFGSLHICEESVKSINKALKRQRKINAKNAILIVAFALYIARLEKQRQAEKERIELLDHELDMIKKKVIIYDLKLKEVNAQKGEAKM